MVLETQAGFIGVARFEMEMSGTWEIQQCLEVRLKYADRMGVTLGERKHCGKSDSLIVL
jgi:hypothetical protein